MRLWQVFLPRLGRRHTVQRQMPRSRQVRHGKEQRCHNLISLHPNAGKHDRTLPLRQLVQPSLSADDTNAMSKVLDGKFELTCSGGYSSLWQLGCELGLRMHSHVDRC